MPSKRCSRGYTSFTKSAVFTYLCTYESCIRFILNCSASFVCSCLCIESNNNNNKNPKFKRTNSFVYTYLAGQADPDMTVNSVCLNTVGLCQVAPAKAAVHFG